jgi:hypothetical protein
MASALGYLVSFVVGGVMGLLEAETIAFSLLEISLSVVFAIVCLNILGSTTCSLPGVWYRILYPGTCARVEDLGHR